MSDGTPGAASAEQFWDERYGTSERIWSGNPNAALVRETSGLAPGRALDLGCGEGADAIWLARQGWQVVAADVSQVALDRAAAHAGQARVADRVDWQRHDLARSFPDGAFDLVSAQFLHSMADLPRDAVLRSAAAAVVPGGVLLVVGHAGWPAWDAHPELEVDFPTPDQVYKDLRLAPDAWEVLASEEYDRETTDPEGRAATRPDNTLKIRRLTG
jgi:SAM-dependent methyltransferase